MKLEIGAMMSTSSLAPLSSSLGALLGRSVEKLGTGFRGARPLRVGGFRGVDGHGGVALWRDGRCCLRLVSCLGRFETDVGVKRDERDEGDEGVVESVRRGWGDVFSQYCVPESVAVGVLALTVAAVAAAVGNRRPGNVATLAESGQVYVLDAERGVSSPVEIQSFVSASDGGVAKATCPSQTRSSLFFASTTLSPDEGLTKLENKNIDEASQEFVEWLDSVRRDAQSEGVSEGVLEWALEDVTVSKESVVQKKTAPEVTLTLDDYLKRMVDERRVSIGASRLRENSELLAEVSQKFGVPSQFLVAIWGIETNYGSFMGNWDIIQSLATISFTEELAARRKYFRGELIEALLMLEKGTAERGAGPEGQKRLRGSWAGAMGQCQFMPTSFRDYALDFDGDGRKDIWESKPDVFASIANYFKEHGWKEGAPIFQKVQVPRKLDKSLVGLGVVKSVLDWEHKHGVHLNPGRAPALPPDEMASLLMPNGPKEGAYLVCNNFRIILRYNASSLYSFAVCELARLIQERASNPFPTPPLLT